jgi:hypothetical protein
MCSQLEFAYCLIECGFSCVGVCRGGQVSVPTKYEDLASIDIKRAEGSGHGHLAFL